MEYVIGALRVLFFTACIIIRAMYYMIGCLFELLTSAFFHQNLEHFSLFGGKYIYFHYAQPADCGRGNETDGCF